MATAAELLQEQVDLWRREPNASYRLRYAGAAGSVAFRLLAEQDPENFPPYILLTIDEGDDSVTRKSLAPGQGPDNGHILFGYDGEAARREREFMRLPTANSEMQLNGAAVDTLIEYPAPAQTTA